MRRGFVIYFPMSWGGLVILHNEGQEDLLAAAVDRLSEGRSVAGARVGDGRCNHPTTESARSRVKGEGHTGPPEVALFVESTFSIGVGKELNKLRKRSRGD